MKEESMEFLVGTLVLLGMFFIFVYFEIPVFELIFSLIFLVSISVLGVLVITTVGHFFIEVFK
jgi:hypothetical protein